MEAQNWWKENSLYLDANARDAFNKAYMAAGSHPDLLKGPKDKESIKLIQKNWSTLVSAGQIIEAAVNLPSLGTAGANQPGDPKASAFGKKETPN